MACLMVWGRLDDKAWKNEQLLSLSKDARLLWFMTLSFVGEGWPENQGCIGIARANALARMHNVGVRAISELVGRGRWELAPPTLYHVHDIEKFMPPQNLKTVRAAAGRRGAQVTNSKRSAIAAANDAATEQQLPQQKSDPVTRNPLPVVSVDTGPTTEKENLVVLPGSQERETAKTLNQTVHRIFVHWREQRRGAHSRTYLTEERSRLIRARLKEGYKEEELFDAILGIEIECQRWSDRGRYDDITDIFKTGAKVEKFRDLWRNPPPPPTPRLTVREEAQRRDAEETEALAAKIGWDWRGEPHDR